LVGLAELIEAKNDTTLQ